MRLAKSRVIIVALDIIMFNPVPRGSDRFKIDSGLLPVLPECHIRVAMIKIRQDGVMDVPRSLGVRRSGASLGQCQVQPRLNAILLIPVD